MKETREIIQAYDQLTQVGKRAALATVVHVEGSSYRGPGARMLVSDEGELTGAISGGCLEGDALRKALLVLSQGRNKVVTYDTSDEEDASIGLQLGCEGIIRVLFEPLDPENPNHPVQLLRKATTKRQESVMATLFSLNEQEAPHPGTCLLLREEGDISGEIPEAAWSGEISGDMKEAMDKKQSLFRTYHREGREVTAFLEYLAPAVSLVVVGAGNDSIPMAEMAGTLGWEVRVVDGRSSHASPQRFASACQVLVSKPEAVLDQIPIDDRTAFVMMTHNYNYDKAMLAELLPRKVKYIGMLVPKKKLDRMLTEITAERGPVPSEELQSVYGPVGLEIGAETAEEIALSILAEIKAVFSGVPGGFLRDKREVIHSRSALVIEEKKLS